MQVFFILFSVHFAVYQYINSKCLYRTHVKNSTFSGWVRVVNYPRETREKHTTFSQRAIGEEILKIGLFPWDDGG